MNAWNINAELEPASTQTVNFHFIMTNIIDITPCVIVLFSRAFHRLSHHITECECFMTDLNGYCHSTHSPPLLDNID